MNIFKRIERYFSAFFKLGRTARQAKAADMTLQAMGPRVDELSDELVNVSERNADLDNSQHGIRVRLDVAEAELAAARERLEAVGDEVGDKLAATLDDLREGQNRLSAQLDAVRDAGDRTSVRVDRLDALPDRIDALRPAIARLEIDQAGSARAYSDLSRRFDLLRFQNGTEDASVPPGPPPERREGLDALLDAFYGRLEDRYRGAREDILERLRVYLPEVRAAAERTGGTVLDLGCGRGEWIELLGHERIAAEGVDLNPVQIADALAMGLPVREGDALKALAEARDNSLSAVTAHHLVEHLPFDTVTWMTREALRALAPGGLLIYETPNCRNLIVGATTFNIDPTHRKPLPAEVLTTLLDTCGYHPVEARPIHPSETLAVFAATGRADPHIADLLFGPQDLAVVGRKPGGGA